MLIVVPNRWARTGAPRLPIQSRYFLPACVRRAMLPGGGDAGAKDLSNVATGPRKYDGQDVPENMTKSAFKRLKKQERMEAERDEFLEKRREKRREARKRNPTRRRLPPKNAGRVDSGLSVVIDCGFDEYMTVPERTSLASQVTRCYSENRRCKRPVDLVFSGFNGNLKSRFETVMNSTHKLWSDVTFTEGDYEAPDKSNAVYLTGDAEDVLWDLEPGCNYYVGGIVDKNRYTNLCLNKAKEMGIRTARLPIDEHIRVSGRRVLTTNQAFELLLRWLELRDWKLAFEATIPSRKLVAGEGNSKEVGNDLEAATSSTENSKEPVESPDTPEVSPDPAVSPDTPVNSS